MIVAWSGQVSDPLSWPAASSSEPLLVRLGDSPGAAVESLADDFFRFQFGTAARQGEDPAVVAVPLGPLGGGNVPEIWSGQIPAGSDTSGGIGIVATRDHVLAHARRSVGEETDIAAAVLSAYTELVSRVRELRYPHLVRIWNLVPEINRGRGDDEVYARFNHGRAVAFDRLGLVPGKYPAATAVGSPPGAPFTVILLASRSEPLAIENPRQVSAYQYPRQYGVRSPAFARAMILPDRAGGQLFISGTASIVGHESQHGDIGSQLRETMENLDQLMDSVRNQLPGRDMGPHCSWRVYLRNPGDLAAVAPEVTRRLGNNVLFLRAEICRRELQLEIEGVCDLTTARNAASG